MLEMQQQQLLSRFDQPLRMIYYKFSLQFSKDFLDHFQIIDFVLLTFSQSIFFDNLYSFYSCIQRFSSNFSWVTQGVWNLRNSIYCLPQHRGRESWQFFPKSTTISWVKNKTQTNNFFKSKSLFTQYHDKLQLKIKFRLV
jgi:hypothetical protein